MAYTSRNQIVLAAIACAVIALALAHTWRNRPGAHDAPLRMAVMRGDLEETERLLAKGANPNLPALDCCEPALKMALLGHSTANQAKLASLLLDHGADPNFVLPDGTPLITYATVFGRISPKILALLAKAGADLNQRDKDGNTVLQAAVGSWGGATDVTMVAALLDGGADPDLQQKDGKTALHLAVWRPGHGREQLVNTLAEHGANPNIRDNKGFTPLASYGFFEEDVIVALVEAGSDLSAKNEEGLTPLQMAAAHHRSKASIAMVERGADVNAEYSSGDTPLFPAASQNDLALAKALVAKGADVNHANRKGSTALHWAAGSFQAEMVAYLVEQGARLDARNQDGLTPLEYARGQSKDLTPERAARKKAVIEFLEAQAAR